MNLQKLQSKLLPPALAWRLNRHKRERDELEKFHQFYSSFVGAGDLCFDIGANLGNRVRGFRSLGCRVVAVEPQPDCFAQLEAQFAIDLQISPDHVLSTTTPVFITTTTSSGRFSNSVWNRVLRVNTTTLDLLIEEHGMPAFVKIDVEGGEPQVLAGLSVPVPALSIEWTPELPDHALTCVDRLETLGRYQYNVSWAETMRFSAQGWRDADTIRRLIREFAGETFFFGDIYARLEPVKSS
jgi:FkbM family methyltransferase